MANKTFACNSNSGSEALVISYESPVASTDRVGAEIFIHIAATGSTLPLWWSLFNPGTCRPTALASVVVGDPASACIDPYSGTSAGGIIYQVGFFGPNTARLLAVVAVPPPDTFSVGPGTEQFAMRINVSHSRTVGTNACAGCNIPVCLGVGTIRLVSNLASEDIELVGGSGIGGSPSTVTWQSAYVLSYVAHGSFVAFDCGTSGPIPTRRSTWSTVKSLYH